MRPKPKQFATQYASMFGDASVVAAYQYRPPYPAETFEFLSVSSTRTRKPGRCWMPGAVQV